MENRFSQTLGCLSRIAIEAETEMRRVLLLQVKSFDILGSSYGYACCINRLMDSVTKSKEKG